MSSSERSLRLEEFTSSRYVVLAYSRTVQSFNTVTGEPVGAARPLAIGDSAPAPAPASTQSLSNLQLSVSIVWDNLQPYYTWNITGYFDWIGAPSQWGGKDQMAVAWANGQTDGISVQGYSGYVHMTNGTYVFMGYPADITPNVGVNYDFDEVVFPYYTDDGTIRATIHENPPLANHSTNVVFKYFHTYSGVDYSVNFSGSGPSITISPTSNQESAAVSTSFND